MAEYRVETRAVVGERAFLTLAEHMVVAPDGERFARVVVEHPGAVAAVPVDRDGRAMLVRQWRVAAEARLLEVPAGKRDVDGEAVEVTARRELEEEVGVRPGRLVKLAEFWNSPGFCTELTHAFVALDLEPVAERHPARAEERDMTIESVGLDDVEHLVATGRLVDAKSIITLLLARRYVEGAYDGLVAQ